MSAPLPLLGAAAIAASLSGTVRDAAGDPVGGALVQAYDVLLRAEETETAADGSWRIEDLPAGTWRVRAVPTYTDNLVTRWHPDAVDFCESVGRTLDVRDDGDAERPGERSSVVRGGENDVRSELGNGVGIDERGGCDDGEGARAN